ncbi:DUF1592 domain-containing protein [Gemmata sp. G18]|uniref:DUF1592 domain-containing protein n=1 Tax=Gemmata palustris TaxID=2822762 RepID=A0ABS5BQM9_9BACT|nr:DUF1592 domain-containing protein [Gemmata palustris]MBP3955961.1 DUF1592 domain-containing protein [Gemmata palustris]
MRIATVTLVLLVGTAPVRADASTGEQIYRKRCASCHGPNGEGAKKYPEPLIGDRTVKELAKVIARTMPEDDPGSCVGADADLVAAYIHETFYSKAARERNHPPRIELSRLTAVQHQNAVADLIGSFRPNVANPSAEKGLRGEYFQWQEDIVSGFYSDKDRAIDRTDLTVRFDWTRTPPIEEKKKGEGYSVRWTGSFTAPRTGDYEFIVRSENGVRLWVNAPAAPPHSNRAQSVDPSPKSLIDAWVGAGSPTDHRGTVRLLGGRSYPIRLQFFKGKEKTASVSLKWKPPLGTEEEIPVRHLSPVRVRETFVPKTKFPPDDRSLGWERGTSISKAWTRATFDTALETAGYVGDHLHELAGLAEKEPDPRAKLRRFCQLFVERAFRHPLSEEQTKVHVDQLFDSTKDTVTGVKRVVAAALISPQFLYRDAEPIPEGYAVAARLSFVLWDSLPDAALLTAAQDGKLTTREEIRTQADRLLSDPRAKLKVLSFFHTWLRLDHATDVVKDAKRFPGFDQAVVADLRVSLDLMLEEIVFGGKSDFRQLLLADHLPLNGRLAAIYGAATPKTGDFTNVVLNAEHRAGVLTHPLVMTVHSYTAETSPIHRGVFLTRGILGQNLRPPQEAFTPFAAELHPALSTRERVGLQTKPANCMTCHGVINPLGFTMEHFDAVGRFRDRDNKKPVDATGSFRSPSGHEAKFANARELAKFAANSEAVHAAFIEQMFSHLVQQPIRAYGPTRLAELRTGFAKDQFHVRNVVAEIAAMAARPPEPKQTPKSR